MCAQLYVQARMQGKWTRLVRPTIQFFLVGFSLYVGYTRVSDYKHHWSDVLVGLLQGALIAVLTVGVMAVLYFQSACKSIYSILVSVQDLCVIHPTLPPFSQRI